MIRLVGVSIILLGIMLSICAIIVLTWAPDNSDHQLDFLASNFYRKAGLTGLAIGNILNIAGAFLD